jgi:hypothetical protein
MLENWKSSKRSNKDGVDGEDSVALFPFSSSSLFDNDRVNSCKCLCIEPCGLLSLLPSEGEEDEDNAKARVDQGELHASL